MRYSLSAWPRRRLVNNLASCGLGAPIFATMVGMASRARIELDRFEVVVLFGILILFSGLMFTFGLMIGYGMPKGAAVEVTAVAPSESGHGVAAHGGEQVGRKIASVSGGHGEAPKEATVSGAALKRAFREAKQQALTESALRDQESDSRRPLSVVDGTAHMEAHPQWNRAPASDDSEDRAIIAKAQELEKTREKAGPPTPVRGLFERKPTATEHFAPTSGSYTVQLGSYATEDESKAKVSALRKSGFNDAYYEAAKLANGDRWYRVGLGSFPTTEWARKSGERLVKRRLATDFIVRRVP